MTTRNSTDDIAFAIGTSSLGLVLVARAAEHSSGPCAVMLGDDREMLVRAVRARFPRAAISERAEALRTLVDRVIARIENPAEPDDMSLDVRGTEFQRDVWQALRDIPAGETASYAQIANRIHRPTSSRAVAAACAANKLAVLIPCHRVVRSDGDLSGYRWGVERKRALLDRERRA